MGVTVLFPGESKENPLEEVWHHVIPSNRRPSHKELSKKLREATECVQGKRWLPADPAKLKANWDELEEACGVESAALEEEQTAILVAILKEAKPEYYAGKHPPERSYERGTGGSELFAFRWQSTFFGNRMMFFKFSLVGAGRGAKAFIYSVHPNRERD